VRLPCQPRARGGRYLPHLDQFDKKEVAEEKNRNLSHTERHGGSGRRHDLGTLASQVLECLGQRGYLECLVIHGAATPKPWIQYVSAGQVDEKLQPRARPNEKLVGDALPVVLEGG
jgi:hypothetical protein